MKRVGALAVWTIIGLLGVWAYAELAFRRGEHVSSAYILIAALCSYAIGYRFYSKWIAARVLMLNDRRATPCEVRDDGRDYVKTNKWIVFGHHFAAISGPGPLVGPVLAAQFGYLPGTLWILLGVTLGGAVQDFVVLLFSIRRHGKSLGQMVKEELSNTAGLIALLAILAIMIILLAVLGLVVVKALADSPWGVFTVSATVPIALFLGLYLRFWRAGKVLEGSAFGIVLLLLAVWGGKVVHGNPYWAGVFGFRDIQLAWALIVYGLAASVLPVWLLLAPRDYLSTFMKLGTIFALAAGVFLVLPELRMPALSRFVDGSGPVVAGKLFPFCFITIACGAISGFHTLIASGTTPKIITRESYARPIGYGAMCLESLVAIMALVAACTLDPGIYLGINVKGDAATTAAQITSLGFPVTVSEMDRLASQVGEKTLFGRTGGAATLAVGMANIFSKAVNGRWLDLWYHFAIMFEALFILTTLDAGTRVGRYLVQDVLGQVWKPLGETRSLRANVLASVLVVGAWGYFLIQGVQDPLGGINSLWPLFGIANQMLAGIALCLVTTIILKTQLSREVGTASGTKVYGIRLALPLITLIPLLWLLSVTLTAGAQKIWNPDPRIGFLAQARVLREARPKLEETVNQTVLIGDREGKRVAENRLRVNRALCFNNRLDATVAGAFLVLVSIIFLLSVGEWILLLAGRKPAVLRESEAVWLPEYAVSEPKPWRHFGAATLGLALAKELSGEAHIERAQVALARTESIGGNLVGANGISDAQPATKSSRQLYAEMVEQRFKGIRRCC